MRDRGQLIGGVSRPLLWVLVMGIGLNPYFRGEIYGEVRFVVPYTYLQFIFPAVIALNIMYTSVQSAVSVIWDRQFGFLREVLVSPLPRATILLGKVLGGATVALFHGCLVLVLAQFADLSLSLGDIAWGLVLMALLAFGLTSLGVVIAGRIRSFEGFGVFSNAVILPLYFTSSSIFPLDPSLTGAQTQRDLSGMAGAAGAMQSDDLCRRRTARRLHPLPSVRAMDGADGARRHGGVVLRDGAARLRQGLIARWRCGCRSVATSFPLPACSACSARFTCCRLTPPCGKCARQERCGCACRRTTRPGHRRSGHARHRRRFAAGDRARTRRRSRDGREPGHGQGLQSASLAHHQGAVRGTRGGVVGSATTRSFLDTTPAYATTGWALIAPHRGAEPARPSSWRPG